jgi:hypothetical protein
MPMWQATISPQLCLTRQVRRGHDAVIAAPDAWRQRVGGVAADGTVAIAAADAAPSPPATRSAMRAAAAAAAQLRASRG